MSSQDIEITENKGLPHSDDHTKQENPEAIEAGMPEIGWSQKLRRFGWVLFTLFWLIFFMILKLPEERINLYFLNLIQKTMSQSSLFQRGFFTIAEGKGSFIGGLSYRLKNILFRTTETSPIVKIQEIIISPFLLPLLVGRIGGEFQLIQGQKQVFFSISKKDSDISFTYQSQQIDLNQLGFLSALTDFQILSQFQGKGAISGNLQLLNTLNGRIEFQLLALQLPAQMVFNLMIPKIFISEITVDVLIEKGKLQINTFQLGKKRNSDLVSADDIQGSVAGTIIFGKELQSSQLDLKINISLSEEIKKAFVILDTLLGTFKKEDHSYAIGLEGTVSEPIPRSIDLLKE